MLGVVQTATLYFLGEVKDAVSLIDFNTGRKRTCEYLPMQAYPEGCFYCVGGGGGGGAAAATPPAPSSSSSWVVLPLKTD